MDLNSTGDRLTNLMYLFLKQRPTMMTNKTSIPVVRTPTNGVSRCSKNERQCQNGACISRIELCPEEQLMNQNTILIMIIVGLAIVIFLVILYCFQQRQRRANRQYEMEAGNSDGCDNESLYAPPPTYDEVIHTNIYPPTPEQLRLRQISEEPTSPMTPPPTYNSALLILAQSAESILRHKPTNRRLSALGRRSLSMDQIENEQGSSPKGESIETGDHSRKDWKSRSRNIFRFSRQFSRPGHSHSHCDKNCNSGHHCQSNLITPPPYPQTPPSYPLTPPPPCTPPVLDPFSSLFARGTQLPSEPSINAFSSSGPTLTSENETAPKPVEPVVNQSSSCASNMLTSVCTQSLQKDSTNAIPTCSPFSEVPSVAVVTQPTSKDQESVNM